MLPALVAHGDGLLPDVEGTSLPAVERRHRNRAPPRRGKQLGRRGVKRRDS